MSRRIRIAFVVLSAGIVVLAGCLARREPPAAPTAALAIAEQAAPTATAPPAATATPTPRPTETPEPPLDAYAEGFTPEGDPFKGSPAAPILVEEFSSYQCPYCKKYFDETFPHVMANYVEAGLVRYVFRDFPLAGQPQSLPAARVANCAGQTGGGSAYWAMHHLLFERQAQWSGNGNADAVFEGYAAELGLESAAFDECRQDVKIYNEIQADLQEGAVRGVRGTPTFFIGGRLLAGAQPYSVFAQMLDEALAEQAPDSVSLELAPVSALPPELRQLPEQAQEAYRFAVAQPDVLDVIPCYCGCGQAGHNSNRMCYIQSQTADGQITFDGHAAT